MKSSVEKLSDTRAKLTVDVPFEDLKGEIDKAYKTLAQQVTIPGFRKGKAPRQLIDARFGRGPVLNEVINDMLPSRYEQACKEHELIVLGQPEIDITKVEDGELVQFTAEVDVRPDIELPDFKDLEVTVPALKIDESAVEDRLTQLRTRFGELKDTERELKDGDYVVLNLSAEHEGEEIEDAKSEGMSYLVGSDDLIPGLDEAVLGASTGDKIEFTTQLKEGDYADKDIQVSAEIVQTKERVLPELDEEFVQMASEFDTVEELRNSIAAEVEEQAKSVQAAAIRDEVLKAALATTEFELPQKLVDEQYDTQVTQQYGDFLDSPEFASHLKSIGVDSAEEFKKQQREFIEENLRNQLFLDTLADAEQPTVTQQEITDHVFFTAQSYGMDPNVFIQQVQQAGQIGQLFADVRRGKALAAAICRVKVTDDAGNSVDPESYFGEETEAAAEEKSAE